MEELAVEYRTGVKVVCKDVISCTPEPLRQLQHDVTAKASLRYLRVVAALVEVEAISIAIDLGTDPQFRSKATMPLVRYILPTGVVPGKRNLALVDRKQLAGRAKVLEPLVQVGDGVAYLVEMIYIRRSRRLRVVRRVEVPQEDLVLLKVHRLAEERGIEGRVLCFPVVLDAGLLEQSHQQLKSKEGLQLAQLLFRCAVGPVPVVRSCVLLKRALLRNQRCRVALFSATQRSRRVVDRNSRAKSTGAVVPPGTFLDPGCTVKGGRSCGNSSGGRTRTHGPRSGAGCGIRGFYSRGLVPQLRAIFRVIVLLLQHLLVQVATVLVRNSSSEHITEYDSNKKIQQIGVYTTEN